MVSPTSTSKSNSTMSAIVNSSIPIDFRRQPVSINTLARTPRLVRDRTPARATGAPNSRSSPKSWNTPNVTTSEAARGMTTEMIAATKYRPRIAAMNAETSISCRPIRKK